MKRERMEWNLRDAFPQEPKACHDALMHAANSVREEKQVRKIPWRTAVIAVLILLATVSVALSVSEWLGWTDYLAKNYGMEVTEGMRQEMDATQQRSFQVGPLTLTLRQCLTDGRIAISGMEAQTTDGSPALCVSEIYDPVSAAGEEWAERLGVDASLTWMEAAKQLEQPLYAVRALMEVTSSAFAGSSMEDAIWSDDGRLTYFNLSYLEPQLVTDTLPVSYYLSVRSYDPATGEELECWVVEEADELTVLPMQAKRSYAIPEVETANGFQLKEMYAELYGTGVYFIGTFTAPQDMQADDEAVHQLLDLLKDENGQEFPSGVLYYEQNTKQWPDVRITRMAPLEEIPQRISVDGVVLEAMQAE